MYTVKRIEEDLDFVFKRGCGDNWLIISSCGYLGRAFHWRKLAVNNVAYKKLVFLAALSLSAIINS